MDNINKQTPSTYKLRTTELEYSKPIERSIKNRKTNKPKRLMPRVRQYGTIDTNFEATDNKITFNIKKKAINEGIPGVGEYQISSPIVKPAYQTYQKSNQVVLVKINHFGGTSSFRSEQQRFVQGQSIYVDNLTPGPGSYATIHPKGESKQKHRLYNESYDLIGQMIRQRRQVYQSIPNYSLPVKEGVQYNGMPRHLQNMYYKINKVKEMSGRYREIALPLEELKKRKNTQTVPIKSIGEENNSLFMYEKVNFKKTIPEAKFTETMYRMQQMKQRQKERNRKIKAILKSDKQRSFSTQRTVIETDNRLISPFKQKYNKNMVNILFDQKYKWLNHAKNRTMNQR